MKNEMKNGGSRIVFIVAENSGNQNVIELCYAMVAFLLI